MKHITLLLLALFAYRVAFSEDISSGEKIFKAQCTACHSVADKVVGPALKDVDKRHDIQWIINFVHSSQTQVKKGDAAAVKLFNDNNNITMPDHPDLSDADIVNIIAYIKDESSKLNQPVAPVANRPVEIKPDYMPISFLDYGTWVLYTIIVVLIIVILFTMVSIRSALNEYRIAAAQEPSGSTGVDNKI